MQLRLQRSQRAGGLAGGTIHFCLDLRADYNAEERTNINRYRLGGQTIYSSRAAQRHLEAMNAHLDRSQGGSTGNRLMGVVRGATSLALAKMELTISIASLSRGHHIQCKDLAELLEAEDTIRSACKDLTKYLEVAATFDGSEIVVEYERGEEKVQITQHAPPLLEYLSTSEPEPATALRDPFAPDPIDLKKLRASTLRTIARVQSAWLLFEGKVVAFAQGKGHKVTPVQVRAVCGGVAFTLIMAASIYLAAAPA